jgi:hypothetical protein
MGAGAGTLTETNEVNIGVICFSIPLVEVLEASLNGTRKFTELGMRGHIHP